MTRRAYLDPGARSRPVGHGPRGPSRTARGLSALAAWAALIAAALSAPASALEHLCHIGKPSYCFKYGQMFCLKDNTLPDRQQACADWTAACLQCHGFIPQCLGGTRPPQSAPLCKSCEAEWRQCMHAIDEAFWPNRRRKPAASAPN